MDSRPTRSVIMHELFGAAQLVAEMRGNMHECNRLLAYFREEFSSDARVVLPTSCSAAAFKVCVNGSDVRVSISAERSGVMEVNGVGVSTHVNAAKEIRKIADTPLPTPTPVDVEVVEVVFVYPDLIERSFLRISDMPEGMLDDILKISNVRVPEPNPFPTRYDTIPKCCLPEDSEPGSHLFTRVQMWAERMRASRTPFAKHENLICRVKVTLVDSSDECSDDDD
jgi:hypothetical protein